MMYDVLNNASRYYPVHPGVAAGLKLLERTDFSALADGRYEVGGDRLFFNISSYRTKPAAEVRPEAHRRYIDIQYILSGGERVLWSPLDWMESLVEERPDHDLWFYSGETQSLPLGEGCFMILFPQDAHGPCVECGAPADVRKVVVKVLDEW